MIIWGVMSMGNACYTLTNTTGSIAMGSTTARKSFGTELEFRTLDLGILGSLTVRECSEPSSECM